jgi:hypothetical protein
MYYLVTCLKHTWPNMTYVSRHTSQCLPNYLGYNKECCADKERDSYYCTIGLSQTEDFSTKSSGKYYIHVGRREERVG